MQIVFHAFSNGRRIRHSLASCFSVPSQFPEAQQECTNEVFPTGAKHREYGNGVIVNLGMDLIIPLLSYPISYYYSVIIPLSFYSISSTIIIIIKLLLMWVKH